MKIRSWIVAALCGLLSAVHLPAAGTQDALDGFPVANFAVTANVSADGDLFGRVLHNRGKLGDWLTDLGALRLSLVKDGTAYPLSSYAQRDVRRLFPFVRADLSGHGAIRSAVHYETWAPLGVDDLNVTTLPVLQLELTLTNPTDVPETLSLCWTPDTLGRSPSYLRDWLNWQVRGCLIESVLETDEEGAPLFMAACHTPAQWLCADTSLEHDAWGNTRVDVVVPGSGSRTIKLALVLYDERGYVATDFGSTEDLWRYTYTHWDTLKQATCAFEEQIPRTGDPELDEYLRWYMVPGVALTKCTAKEKVVTLGYCELNQRDSYWASWLHLVLFPQAERTMIEESIAGMRPGGKIPTCLLPRIDRKDDIDINAFFLLRSYRYFSYHHDRDLIETHWDALKQAADWLLSRDLEGTGLPMQTSTWADWKDVSGVEGRKYSPYACLVYTAAMRRMARMAAELRDGSAEAKYAAAADRAYSRINLPREQGGLWNGRYYCQLWNDGRSDDRLLQDQTVGILLGVVPRDRARRIIHSLNRTNATPYGICETYPYYPAAFGYAPATYHNGGVWPWLSFADDWARLTLGRRREAIALVKQVARADLVDSGDWAANEHLNSLTGENLGFLLQGWNAGLFGLCQFGLADKNFSF
ncbi:MAG: hypothetical protein IJ654_08990 [Bacteroidales bacterium]|nr:hypothetical protein [Bacteroidales bacterium]